MYVRRGYRRRICRIVLIGRGVIVVTAIDGGDSREEGDGEADDTHLILFSLLGEK